MSKKDGIKIGEKILSEDDLKFPVEYNGETFMLTYPSPEQRLLIERKIALNLNGASRNSFSDQYLLSLEATVYANNLVIRKESPAWFTSAWTCYDESCLIALYTGYLSFRNKFSEQFQKNRLASDSKQPPT